MIGIDSLRDFVRGLDKKELKLYGALYMGVCAFIVAGIMVRHVYLVREAKDKIKQLNQARAKVQGVLTDFGQVAQQRNKIDALLKKDKNFYLQKFFQELTQKLGIAKEATEKPSTQKLENGYTEESLNINLLRITTQQLCELLQGIEKEERIYIKNIDITKTVAKKINVIMVIATLIPKSE